MKMYYKLNKLGPKYFKFCRRVLTNALNTYMLCSLSFKNSLDISSWYSRSIIGEGTLNPDNFSTG